MKCVALAIVVLLAGCVSKETQVFTKPQTYDWIPVLHEFEKRYPQSASHERSLRSLQLTFDEYKSAFFTFTERRLQPNQS